MPCREFLRKAVEGYMFWLVLDYASSRSQEGNWFSEIGYRPDPVARYITQTAPWRNGRRKVLDWGCGGGGLSRALAEKGADHVLAVDMDVDATAAAQQTLEPFPNAMATGPCLDQGHISYSCQFDIVVSSAGALSFFTTDAPRLPMVHAWKQAVQACREGGIVVVSQGLKSWNFRMLALLVLSSGIGWHVKDPLLWDGQWWFEVAFWVGLANPFLRQSEDSRLALSIGYSIVGSIVSQNIARSFMLRRWRISSIMSAGCVALEFLRMLWREKRFVNQLKQQMRNAGLRDVKHCHRLVFPVTEPIAGWRASLASPTQVSALQPVQLPFLAAVVGVVIALPSKC
ncbi:expressed unknown protein [Seminavis robusta]|uniref:Methyltransferase domain-containing protein n=1 Tax=Seminavis robusta TaxID=568900 RepID=A0A9N8DPC4_9STRA|nr:expressed unknown protein [Seminavis robusta]|eukprot:Sro191_g082320.1 n/a (342) ;mRNA; r:67983-69269